MMKTQEIPKHSPPLSRRRKLLFILISLFFLWLFLDTFAYILLRRVATGLTYQIFHGVITPTDEELAIFYRSRFHPQWGWNLPRSSQGPLGNRKSREYEKKAEYKIKVFGDSFTKGDGGIHETFQYFVEEKTGWECLNYGVGGYGTDQALLKYRDNQIKTKYTLLCILDENIARCVNIFRGFLYQRQNLPKPRFMVSDDNSITLVDNPVKNRDDLQKLKDGQFIDSLKKYDYWANYWEQVNAPLELKWPATLTMLAHLDFFVENLMITMKHNSSPDYQSATDQAEFYHLYRENSESLKIMRYIINEFIDTANSRGEIPIIVIFPITHSVDVLYEYGRKPYQSLVNYLEEIQCHFIDFGDVFVTEAYLTYYKGHGAHFSVEGDKRVADELISYIQQLEHQ